MCLRASACEYLVVSFVVYVVVGYTVKNVSPLYIFMFHWFVSPVLLILYSYDWNFMLFILYKSLNSYKCYSLCKPLFIYVAPYASIRKAFAERDYADTALTAPPYLKEIVLPHR